MNESIPIIKAVSVAVLAGGAILLVERAREPSKGKYAFPGGRVELGEALEDAARRELGEETGLVAATLTELVTRHIPGNGCIYELTVFRTDAVSGVLLAGDDAASAGFFDREEIGRLPMSLSTLEVIDTLLAE